MTMQAQEAKEPEVADIDLDSPEFDQAFADASAGKPEKPDAATDEASKAKDDDGKPASEQTPPPAPTPAPPVEPKKDEGAAAPPPPAPSPESDGTVTPPPTEPLTAMQQAEAEAAKLEADDKASSAGKSTIDLLPDGYKNAPEIIATEAFAKFFESAPEHIQYLGVNGGPKGVCAAIDAFNAHVALQSAKAAVAAESGTASGSAKARRIMDELGDVSITQSDGTKTSVSEFLKEYGDLGEAVAAIADSLAEKKVKGYKATATPAFDSDRMNKLEAELSEMRYWRAVSLEHSDAERVVKSEAFKKFAETASPGLKRLMASPNPMHGVKVLDAFKEIQVGNAKSALPAPVDKIKSMHSDTARGRTVAKRGENPNDFDAGFEEGLRK